MQMVTSLKGEAQHLHEASRLSVHHVKQQLSMLTYQQLRAFYQFSHRGSLYGLPLLHVRVLRRKPWWPAS